jgi:hypothetical protein
VVWLNIQFNNITSQLAAKHLNTIMDFMCNFSLKYTISILWNPNNMILTMPNYMIKLLEPAHFLLLL